MVDRTIIDWSEWTASAAGQYVLGWEQAQLDRAVSDIFGFRAVQLGAPQIDALRENRMPTRVLTLDPANRVSSPCMLPPTRAGADRLAVNWGALSARRSPGNGAATPDALPAAHHVHAAADGDSHAASPPTGTAPRTDGAICWGDFFELPYANQSIDLLVMPHTLEFTDDPHALLREAERVLVPEGKLIIVGFNSLSLWGVRQSVGRLTHRPFVPADADLIAFLRLKDWIKLLGFELSRGRFGCYRPPLASPKWLNRYDFMERAGDRWWPIFGAVYMITAVKRVKRMRLIGPAWKKKSVPVPSLAPVGAPTPSSRRRE